MLRIIAASAVALTLSAPAHANEDAFVFCEEVGGFAEAAMGAHQRGVSMSEIMGGLRDQPMTDKLRGLLIAVVRDAYAQPRFNTDEYQRRIIGEFRDTSYELCLDTML